ncbi:hypothetical protein SLEP1_g34375 [Rubroshorea leprosula]|uniref:Uncharacterized protein n=1 Tax=Rubroshorea leprosula TaxID=152421 RepID=A0AAV5KJU8_9ROSI|nr:hypothetical protein SLEP1_g34375 [Rubroshorea leprosula]
MLGDAWSSLGSASVDNGYFRRNYSTLAVAVAAIESEEEEVGESKGEESDQGEGEEKEGIDLVSFFCLFCVFYVYFLGLIPNLVPKLSFQNLVRPLTSKNTQVIL